MGSTTDERARHWDAAYTRRGADRVSWHQSDARVSLELIDTLGIGPEAGVIDVGGGASVLAERLVERRFGDVSVLDISAEALAAAQARVRAGAPIQWLHQDLLSWRPERRYDLWHDRAVFHFLVEEPDRERYLETMRHALRPGGAVVLGTFAADGPTRCSGLPIARYSAEELAQMLGAGFETVEGRREVHVTPGGSTQPFTWIGARVHGW